jgi:hypothetical protein
MYVERLLDRLPPHVRREILDEVLPADALAGMGATATHADLERLTAGTRGRLLARVLRAVDASDEEIAGLAREGHLAPRTPDGDVTPVTVTFVSRDGETGQSGVPSAAGGVALPLLAASTMFLAEVAVRARAATLAIGAGVSEDAAVIEAPRVLVSPGSVEINLGGGLFASGVGLLVACAAGMVVAPVVGPVAGVALLTGGAIEMALDWRKKAVETAKLQEELRIVQRDNGAFAEWQQRELRSLEVERKRLEVRKEELEVQQKMLGIQEQKRALALPPAAHGTREEAPPSALVSLRVIQAEAAAHGVSEAYAVHLVNRVLPAVVEGRRHFDDVRARRG